ncbi:uncharacterized protein DUF4136 [Chitinophaga japonensis]|uniref:Uncharacterized protein DUF4136 n=2 Tax=Chitinophaga japonensis TaxID=104662 RepID=A0A562SMS7_CHIJA|nr:uncharacterized protein DUF4136 [Chitinophaga japonensis]
MKPSLNIFSLKGTINGRFRAASEKEKYVRMKRSMIQFVRKTGMMLAVAGAAVLVLNSCSKDPLNDMTDEESRIYVTNRDTTANFASYNTFSIVDSVAVASNGDTAKRALTEYDRQLIDAVKSAMQARGYTEVDRAAKPDLAINLTRIDESYANTYYNPGYWAGWGGYWDPWYWGYPGYGYYFPTYYTVYYQERAVSIDLLDLKNADADKQIDAIWNAMFRGAGVWNSSNINSMVTAVFDQSPYLQQ